MISLALHTILYFVTLLALCDSAYVPPRIEVKRLSNVPIISSWNNNSDFLYNYNSAFMPMINDSDTITLLVRVQNLRNDSTSIYDVGPSKLAVSRSIDSSYLKYTYISEQDILIDTDQDYQSYGAEDPRIVLYNNTYYLTYTAVTKNSEGNLHAQLALATCEANCFTKTNWKYHGPIFSDGFWSKSGSLLIMNATRGYLFYNYTDIALAETKDLINYNVSSKSFLRPRYNYFDSDFLQAGPPPLKLSDRNYLFLYNSARYVTTPNPKHGWNAEYNLGWAILNGENPTQILARCNDSLLSPGLDWEKCDNTSGIWAHRGLTPLVVFVEGWKQTAIDTFLVWYQGCDSVLGLAELKVYF